MEGIETCGNLFNVKSEEIEKKNCKCDEWKLLIIISTHL